MSDFMFAAIGIEPNDLTALKSTLVMVTGDSANWNQVDNPEQANVVFVCGLPPAQLSVMNQKLGSKTLLAYCCGRGETPPEGFITIRKPLRPSDISQLVDEVNKRISGGGSSPSKNSGAEEKGPDNSFDAWAGG